MGRRVPGAKRTLGLLSIGTAMGRTLFILATALWGGCVACHDQRRPELPRDSKGTVRLRAITDAQPVRMLLGAGSFLFSVGTTGIDRWDPQSERVLSLTKDHGLPGDGVLAIAADVERLWLWIATDGGLGYYDLATETFSEVAPSRTVELGRLGADGALHLAPASDGGVWIGHPRGLFYTNPSAHWTSTPITGPISALALGEDGRLWMGTSEGVVGREPGGETFRYGAAEGCDVAQVQLIARAPAGGVLVVGDNAAGKQRVAVRKGGTWTTFKISPEVRIDAIAPLGDTLIARGGRRLFQLAAVGASKRRLLTRDGVRLLAVTGEASTAPPLTIELLPAQLPADATAIATLGDAIFVGTRDVGIGRWRSAAPQPAGWLRRRQLLDGATTLTVACASADDCWLATGARRAWHFDGQGFAPAGPEAQQVLAIVRGGDGTVHALHRAGEAGTIEVSRIEGEHGEGWASTGVRLHTPGERPEVSFARFAPGGMLWVGLRYFDGRNVRPWGVALVDLLTGAIAYHHETHDRVERRQGVLPVPVDVVDGTFASEDEVWLATTEGAARLVGDELTVWNEANGMASEVTRAVAVSPGGFVLVATGAGVGLFDGETWSFPPQLSFTVNDLAIGEDGKLWMATDRGIAVYDGKTVKRLDVRRGLLENTILDIAIDQLGRIWARGHESITLVTP
jgi:hypothetical protein